MLIVDRFEGEWAIIEEDERLLQIPRSWLPADCQEGDILRIEVDQEATQERKARLEARMKNLFKN